MTILRVKLSDGYPDGFFVREDGKPFRVGDLFYLPETEEIYVIVATLENTVDCNPHYYNFWTAIPWAERAELWDDFAFG